MVRYALAAEDKEARRDAILTAARTLFVRDPEKLPSAAAIATEAGLAKGTVYLYFATKEEIFMDLLHVERVAMMARIRAAFAPDTRTVDEKISAFIADYVAHVTARPDISKLESLGYSVLERNIEQDRLRAYKQELGTALVDAGTVVEAALGLAPGEGPRVLVHSYALTQGLWQALDIPPDCLEMMGDAAVAFTSLDFTAELKVSLDRYWRGLRSQG
ncbi:TetR family transcriptional regulator [Luteibacter sp. dw_328]|uniref:TetR family transcriptional regulator n=1 Tax=Luteibacter sp. dw_328 TaxID=2719796 RepID=UPI001BD479AF|nr:TetR family transcriptional regulator [Luteibacter sp. dw_328]